MCIRDSNCSSYLTLHKNRNRLICHHCGFSKFLPKICASCTAEDSFKTCGHGVEKLAEEIAKKLPKARIALATSDHIKTVKENEELILGITNGEFDIIIGTQMLAKGHHFPALNLVGIIDADSNFYGAELRGACLLYTSPSPRDLSTSRMPSSA